MQTATITKAVESPRLLRFITAGSVDDGKSTLIGRLLHDSKAILADQFTAIERATAKRGFASAVDLSLVTDGLQAEREQGITIDVAYRYFATGKRKFIIADTPGHEQYTRNMVTAASTADAAIILIDARLGVQTQSRRHAYLASLLRIPHLIVAVNKMDLVGFDQTVFDRICKEFSAFAAKLGVEDVRFIPISALEGDNVVESSTRAPWYSGEPLLTILEGLPNAPISKGDSFRFPVQYVSRPNLPGFHDFRGYMGRVEGGRISRGDRVTILPSGLSSKIDSIVTLDGGLESAESGASITLTLADDIDISRGDMIVRYWANDTVPRVAREIDATLCWFDVEPLNTAHRFILKHTTRSVRCQIDAIEHRVDVNTLEQEKVETLKLNDISQVTLKLQQPIACDDYAVNRVTGSFILIDEFNNRTVAAGMIEQR